MNLKIVALASQIEKEVDPQLAEYILELGRSGKSFDQVVEKLRNSMRAAEAARNAK